MAKGSVFKTLGANMTDFARGVYSNIDTKAGTKMAASQARKSGLDFKTAEKMVNKSINSSAGKFGAQVSDTAPLKGIRDSARNYTKAKNIHAKKGGSAPAPSIMKSVKEGHMKADGTYDMGKIAGTAFTVGVAGRIATGGGLYKDRYGNTNLPGVPFI